MALLRRKGTRLVPVPTEYVSLVAGSLCEALLEISGVITTLSTILLFSLSPYSPRRSSAFAHETVVQRLMDDYHLNILCTTQECATELV